MLFADILDSMATQDIQDKLKALVEKKGLRQTARELGLDNASLYRSINSHLRQIDTVQRILNLFGYDLKVVKRRKAGDKE